MLVVNISDELWLQILLYLKGDRKAIAELVREVLQEYLEAFNGTP